MFPILGRANALLSDLGVEDFQEKREQCGMCLAILSEQPTYHAQWQQVRASYVKCAGCGYLWQNPPLLGERLLEIYQDPSYWGAGTSEYLYHEYSGQGDWYYKDSVRRFNRIRSLCDNAKKVLEVGCGAGHSLQALSDLGMSCTGIDPSASLIEFARKTYDARFECSTIEEYEGEKESYDLVVSWGTSMNFHDPLASYAKIFSLLKAGGLFAMDLLDIEGLFSFANIRKRKKAVHVTCCPSKRGIGMAHDRIGYRNRQFLRYVPYYSLGFIGTLTDLNCLKRVGASWIGRNFGVYAAVPGFYLFCAQK